MTEKKRSSSLHDDAHGERDHLAVSGAVRDTLRRPMAERLEIAISWDAVASELRAGLADVMRRSRTVR